MAKKKETERILADYLAEKAKKQQTSTIGYACGMFLLGMAVTFLTFGLIYAFLIVISGFRLFGERLITSLVAGLLVALCFIGHFTKGRYLRDPMSSFDHSDRARFLYVGIFFAGPRLIEEGADALWRAVAMTKIDYGTAAVVIRLLLKKQGRVSFEEIWEQIPPDMDMKEAVEQLRLLGGVLLVRSDPPGLTLQQETRIEFANVVRDGRREYAD